MSKDITLDELEAQELRSRLEQKIADWSLYRLKRERRMKYMVARVMIVVLLILLVLGIRILSPGLIAFPFENIMILGLAVWLTSLALKYYRAYKDKKCTRSADEIIRLAAEYNEVVKDIPTARHFNFLPPDLIEPEKPRLFFLAAKKEPVQ